MWLFVQLIDQKKIARLKIQKEHRVARIIGLRE